MPLYLQRRHTRICSKHKKLKVKEIDKCSCPFMITGTDLKGVFHNREALHTINKSTAYDLYIKIERGEMLKPTTAISLESAVSQYRQILVNRGLKPQSIKNGFDYPAKLLLEMAAEDKITECRSLTTAHLDKLIASWPAGTRPAHIGQLKRFLTAARSRGWIPIDLGNLYDTPKRQASRGTTAPFDLITEDPMILAAAPNWRDGQKTRKANGSWNEHPQTAAAIILLLRHTGLRLSDAMMFDTSRLRFDGKVYRCEALRQKKTDHPVTVTVSADVANALLTAPRISDAYAFWDGETPVEAWGVNFSAAVMKPLEKVSGVPNIHAHRFRDTFAVEALTVKKLGIRAVSRLLGHKSVATTLNHYEHWVREDQEELDRKTE